MLAAKDRLRRLIWCRKRMYWPVQYWANIIFSDEQKQNTSQSFVKYKPRFITPGLQGGGGSVDIWDAFLLRALVTLKCIPDVKTRNRI
jgi:hypothetical protein